MVFPKSLKKIDNMEKMGAQASFLPNKLGDGRI